MKRNKPLSRECSSDIRRQGPISASPSITEQRRRSNSERRCLCPQRGSHDEWMVRWSPPASREAQLRFYDEGSIYEQYGALDRQPRHEMVRRKREIDTSVIPRRKRSSMERSSPRVYLVRQHEDAMHVKFAMPAARAVCGASTQVRAGSANGRGGISGHAFRDEIRASLSLSGKRFSSPQSTTMRLARAVAAPPSARQAASPSVPSRRLMSPSPLPASSSMPADEGSTRMTTTSPTCDVHADKGVQCDVARNGRGPPSMDDNKPARRRFMTPPPPRRSDSTSGTDHSDGMGRGSSNIGSQSSQRRGSDTLVNSASQTQITCSHEAPRAVHKVSAPSAVVEPRAVPTRRSSIPSPRALERMLEKQQPCGEDSGDPFVLQLLVDYLKCKAEGLEAENERLWRLHEDRIDAMLALDGRRGGSSSLRLSAERRSLSPDVRQKGVGQSDRESSRSVDPSRRRYVSHPATFQPLIQQQQQSFLTAKRVDAAVMATATSSDVDSRFGRANIAAAVVASRHTSPCPSVVGSSTVPVSRHSKQAQTPDTGAAAAANTSMDTTYYQLDRLSVIELHTAADYSQETVCRLKAYCMKLEDTRTRLKEALIHGSRRPSIATYYSDYNEATAAGGASWTSNNHNNYNDHPLLPSGRSASQRSQISVLGVSPTPRKHYFASSYADVEVDATLHDVPDTLAVDTRIVVTEDGTGSVSKRVVETTTVIGEDGSMSECVHIGGDGGSGRRIVALTGRSSSGVTPTRRLMSPQKSDPSSPVSPLTAANLFKLSTARFEKEAPPQFSRPPSTVTSGSTAVMSAAQPNNVVRQHQVNLHDGSFNYHQPYTFPVTSSATGTNSIEQCGIDATASRALRYDAATTTPSSSSIHTTDSGMPRREKAVVAQRQLPAPGNRSMDSSSSRFSVPPEPPLGVTSRKSPATVCVPSNRLGIHQEKGGGAAPPMIEAKASPYQQQSQISVTVSSAKGSTQMVEEEADPFFSMEGIVEALHERSDRTASHSPPTQTETWVEASEGNSTGSNHTER